MLFSPQEHKLCHSLRDLPFQFDNRYTDDAARTLLEVLFTSLAGDRDDYLALFFPHGTPPKDSRWSLRVAQGAIDGAEYTEGARGHPCGHIFKSGEATYRCKTCTVDETCVLCAKCFDASDHEGHTVYVSISPGNSGCCDCGDPEAWVRPMHCNIHSELPTAYPSKAAGKAKEAPGLPPDLLESIHMTVSRALDYLCDVFSCSPEQLRLPKTKESVLEDERLSRLNSKWYSGSGEEEREDKDDEFALILWNDEKHTVTDVANQVARACKQTHKFGLAKSNEINDDGRSVVEFSRNVPDLLRKAKIIEEIKLTVTVRSARDTFREQMCGTIVEWIHDISGCSVGADAKILRNAICEEMLRPWRMGSEAHHAKIGADGIDDHEVEDDQDGFPRLYQVGGMLVARARPRRRPQVEEPDEEQGDNDWDDDEDGGDAGEAGDDEMDLDHDPEAEDTMDLDLDMEEEDMALEHSEATLAGYPPPPPPPPAALRPPPTDGNTPADSDEGEFTPSQSDMVMDVPKTPKGRARSFRPPRPPKYWLEKPEGCTREHNLPVHEDLRQRVRLDFMILYDLRMWKKMRIDLRDVYISTVVTIPYFKRVLGLRFAGLYTTLAQLYLIADREPDHSIINLSLQMLTTPSITAEVVERGNFLSNLLAILYTFLTTRQVGYPSDVNPWATLAFEQGAVTNRRMYHFFLDMKYLLGSDFIQDVLDSENRYLLQFLDLVKLHQGICPNVRAVGEHLEYETDAWISASLITREINKLCRQFADAFNMSSAENFSHTCRAIRQTAKVVIINSLGAERRRFDQAEIKSETRFKTLRTFEFDMLLAGAPRYEVVDFTVEKEPMSFHHALHYTFSWLVDRGKAMTRDQLQDLLTFSVAELREAPTPLRAAIPDHPSSEYVQALFDFPLRLCAWLAQMRAGLWVRNGITLKHQMSQYRGVGHRDVSYSRDIFLLQTAFVVCDPSTILAQMIDRFCMEEWVRGKFQIRSGWEDHQVVDVGEDFVHLLIIFLSDRTALIPPNDDSNPHLAMVRRDITHVLCFRPLSYSELTSRLADKITESEEFSEVLSEMTRFRPPEGLSDSGTFELKEQYLEELDPYSAQYSRNQREEAENIYKNHMGKKLGKPASEVVFEPTLRPIRSGIFEDIGAFTRLPLFAQTIYYLLEYVFSANVYTPQIPSSRLESFLQFVLQLVLLAVLEDRPDEPDAAAFEGDRGFSYIALTADATDVLGRRQTIFSLLHFFTTTETYSSSWPKARLILQRLQQRWPSVYNTAMTELGLQPERMDTASPAVSSSAEEMEFKEKKKKEALDRQARVMAQFKEQQNSFMQNQAIDWGEDFSDEDVEEKPAEHEKIWKYPNGTCILCQEETNDQRLYGTFVYMTESAIFRQTDTKDGSWVSEALKLPSSLDRSADHIRPFGVASENRKTIEKVTSTGERVLTERQQLSKGFPKHCMKRGTLATGCGHIMHYSCFEVYIAATRRKHETQVARAHPERSGKHEYLCPLCKALGNAFLPIVWKGKKVSYPGVLEPENSHDTNDPFLDWLEKGIPLQISKLDKSPERSNPANPLLITRQQRLFRDYSEETMISQITSRLADLGRSAFFNLASDVQARRSDFVPTYLTVFQDAAGNAVVPADASTGPGMLGSPPPLELARVYLERIRDVMKANHLHTRHPYSPGSEDLVMTDTLSSTLGHSITCAEIAQRGVESSGSLLDKISPQSLTNLRVLSETIDSYIAIGVLRGQGTRNKTAHEFNDTQSRQLFQLLRGHPAFSNSAQLDWTQVSPLLREDAFQFLADASVYVAPAVHLEVHHVMRLCYLAEVVRVIVSFCYEHETVSVLAQMMEAAQHGQEPYKSVIEHQASVRSNTEILEFENVVWRIRRAYNSTPAPTNEGAFPLPPYPTPNFYHILRALVDAYTLPFLRKCAILLHVRSGVEFPSTPSSIAHEPELHRLTSLLRLPTVEEMISALNWDTSGLEPPSVLSNIVTGWIHHWAVSTQLREAKDMRMALPISLSHPGIFELIGLPKNYDTLTDEAIHRRCPTTGKELTDPALCLFCGDIFCSQAVCCTKDRLGGCTQHQAKCGGNVGIFINIRKCMVLFMNQGNGSWAVAPYLDKHGEVDPTLRRHHQLFLNQRRYDALLRAVWLNHGIPSTIARRLEGDINNGGWESM
ncbi:hypothetical protein BDY21DRAFT_343857 [Lineolata rhizophorae]|uniref:E3 ubiquitin-protein ligase n=1 Tax=Lineolata rhizophorae TaxID=578093 RepID=A0A6A6P0V7_9PEZI|nr:hypothetical protein BDY21DRAFT_343857 [Lineolata rhizophorae]